RKAASRPGYGPSRHPQSGKGMGVSGAGGVAKPGWATTKQPIPGGKKIPANNSYAGGHKNVKAAVMKAVRLVAKHKDKRGSTAHHGKGGGRAPRRELSVPEKHQLRIARDTMRMTPAMARVMGGPDIEESKKIIQELTGRPYREPRDEPAVGPGVTGGWQAEERQSPSGGGRPMPEPIVIDPDETPAQQRARRQERDRKEGFQQDAERRYDAPSGPYNEEDV
ncbi:hypothetical protein LCGC14_2963280, partial [marine sediment metagenome]